MARQHASPAPDRSRKHPHITSVARYRVRVSRETPHPGRSESASACDDHEYAACPDSVTTRARARTDNAVGGRVPIPSIAAAQVRQSRPAPHCPDSHDRSITPSTTARDLHTSLARRHGARTDQQRVAAPGAAPCPGPGPVNQPGVRSAAGLSARLRGARTEPTCRRLCRGAHRVRPLSAALQNGRGACE